MMNDEWWNEHSKIFNYTATTSILHKPDNLHNFTFFLEIV